MLAGSILLFLDKTDGWSGTQTIVMGSIFGVLPVTGGLQLCRKMKKRGQLRSREIVERQLLELASKNNGCLTIAETSMKMSIPSDEAKKILDECHLNNLAELEVSDSGAVLYRFTGLINKI